MSIFKMFLRHLYSVNVDVLGELFFSSAQSTYLYGRRRRKKWFLLIYIFPIRVNQSTRMVYHTRGYRQKESCAKVKNGVREKESYAEGKNVVWEKESYSEGKNGVCEKVSYLEGKWCL